MIVITTRYFNVGCKNIKSVRLAGQDTPRLLWYYKVHFRVQKTPTLDLIVIQINVVHIFTSQPCVRLCL
jgi:hypothetical protein